MTTATSTLATATRIGPQPGPQRIFLSTSADIAVYGGAAGGGKTWALLLEPLRHVGNPDFGAVLFRRTYPEITGEGGMWDESKKLYSLLDARANETELQWTFPRGSRVTFAHLQLERDKERWKGAQIPLLGFDQLETFSATQFWYMLTRNRSTCGVRPYVRGTANPEPGWLADFLAWWIGDDGYAIPERSGVLRWALRYEDEIIWADSREELEGRYRAPDGTPIPPKSVTFILATLFDNRILMQKDPGYLANLLAQPLVERERLLGERARGGNWKIKPAAGKVFKRHWFEIVDAYPADAHKLRYWDLAATEERPGRDPDWTAGCLMAEKAGVFWLCDVRRVRETPKGVEDLVKQTAQLDSIGVGVWIEQEPGSSGVNTIDHYQREVLKGFAVRGNRTTGSKAERANPLSAAAEAGNVKLVRGAWNEAFLLEAESFPPEEGKGHDDQVDAASGALAMLIASDLPFSWLREQLAEKAREEAGR